MPVVYAIARILDRPYIGSTGYPELVVTVSEALHIIRSNVRRLAPTEQTLADAVGKMLAENLVSPHDVPPFDQSAMDGYAIRHADLAAGQPLRIIGSAAAGQSPAVEWINGSAMRIFTGAPIPPGTDTVVIQEHVTVTGEALHIEKPPILPGANVRPGGSQNRRGDTILTAGTRLDPGAVGFVASVGIDRVPVIPYPRVGIIVTGKELVPPGMPLSPGEIHESNSHALLAALSILGVKPILTVHCDDDKDLITDRLQASLSMCDIVITTGGVSVGDHDHVRTAANRCGVDTLFYKVRQRPGKPMYLGRKNDALVFGLPGNPASVLTAFYAFVVPALHLLSGQDDTGGLPQVKRRLLSDINKKEGLTYFLRGRLQGEAVEVFPDQASYKMNSWAGTDALLLLEESRTRYEAGDLVDVLVLPNASFPIS